jgi:acetate kinase
LVFSGGIGEGNSYLRKKILKRLEFFGLTKEKVLALRVDEEGLIFKRMENEN